MVLYCVVYQSFGRCFFYLVFFFFFSFCALICTLWNVAWNKIWIAHLLCPLKTIYQFQNIVQCSLLSEVSFSLRFVLFCFVLFLFCFLVYSRVFYLFRIPILAIYSFVLKRQLCICSVWTITSFKLRFFGWVQQNLCTMARTLKQNLCLCIDGAPISLSNIKLEFRFGKQVQITRVPLWTFSKEISGMNYLTDQAKGNGTSTKIMITHLLLYWIQFAGFSRKRK